MPFQLPQDYIDRQKEIHDLQYVTIHEEKIHVSELEDRSVTPDMQKEMIMNSYARDKFPPKLTNEALIITAEQYLSQCLRKSYPCSTYDEALIHIILPELIQRLKETQSLSNNMQEGEACGNSINC